MTIQNKNIIKISDECSDVSEEHIECLLDKVSKTEEKPKKPKTKSSRCKETINWSQFVRIAKGNFIKVFEDI